MNGGGGQDGRPATAEIGRCMMLMPVWRLSGD